MIRVSAWCFRALLRLTLIPVLVAGTVSEAAAQTTVTLVQPSHVESATVRGGSYANTNLSSILETRSSTELEYLRRALLRFDTQNTIPDSAPVTKAVMTVTVKGGSGDATRRIAVYQL